MSGVTISDTEKLRVLADGFPYSCNFSDSLYGCIGSLDGIAIELLSKVTISSPGTFFCRKEKHALPLQGAVDNKLHSVYMSGMFCVSNLGICLRVVGIMPGYWISTNHAYICENGLVTSCTKGDLRGEQGFYCNSLSL